MNPVMLCFLRFPRVFDLICHSEYLPSSKVPLNKSTHRSFWAICLTFTSSFHLRSPRTTCRREPGNSAFIWTTQPSNEQIFTPKFDLWVGHGQILDVQKSVKVRLVTCDFSPFSDAKIGSQKKKSKLFRVQLAIHPPARSRPMSTCSLVEAAMGLKQRCQNFVPFDQDLRDVQVCRFGWKHKHMVNIRLKICMSPNFQRLHYWHVNGFCLTR